MAHKYIVDTHALIWFLEGNKRLSQPAKAIMGASDSEMILPLIVLAEATVIIEKGRTTIPDISQFLAKLYADPRIEIYSLTLEIWTDGSLEPEDAMAYASKLLVDHLDIFVNFEGELESAQEVIQDDETERLSALFKMRVDELELSVRSSNCLRLANIHTIGELVKNPESDMLKYKNFGRKSLIELSEVLGNLGLHFGMDVEKLTGTSA